MPAASFASFQRDFRIAVVGSYLAALLGGGGSAVYVSPVFTGKSAIYGDWHPEWEFWSEPAGLATAVGVFIALASLNAGWRCLVFKGEPGQGLDRAGQGDITRSMSIAGLTIICVLLTWLVRGIF